MIDFDLDHTINLRDMQPLGRPVLRALLTQGNPSIGWQLTVASRHSFAQPWRTLPSSICSHCRVQAIEAPARFFSSQPPSKDDKKAETIQPPEAGETPTQKASTETTIPPSHNAHYSSVKEKFSQVMDNLQSRVLTASHTLNDMTGYSAIEAIKAENERLETSLSEAHERLRTARQAYKTSNAKRAATQREVTTLLARKDSWSPTDLERFTELYRTDHELEGAVSTAQEQLTEAEVEEQTLSQRLNAGMLKRYHEEQIWSDRIRRASTWGTWGLMGMNFVLFVVLQFVAEPWKRRRLTKGVVAAVAEQKDVLEEVRGDLAVVKASLEAKAEEVEAPVTMPEVHIITGDSPTAASTWKEFLLEPAQWKVAAQDLCSDRRLDLRMKDASMWVLEGAAAGAAVAGGLVWILVRS